MQLPDDFKAEADYRSRISANADYKWSVAVVEIQRVSDKDRLLGDLKEYVRNYDRHVPSDKIMRGQMPDELFLLMRGTEDECLWMLSGFFGGPGIASRLKDNDLIARVGVCQYERGKTPLELIQGAYVRQTIYQIGNVQAPQVESGFIIPEIERIFSETK